MNTTELAQRRLLESLAAQDHTAGGLEGFLIAFPIAIEVAIDNGCPEMAEVWRSVANLARCVQSDNKEAAHG